MPISTIIIHNNNLTLIQRLTITHNITINLYIAFISTFYIVSIICNIIVIFNPVFREFVIIFVFVTFVVFVLLLLLLILYL